MVEVGYRYRFFGLDAEVASKVFYSLSFRNKILYILLIFIFFFRFCIFCATQTNIF